jgi:hypothetical protein
MVHAVRAGNSERAVARQFRVSRATVRRWVQWAGDKRLDRVDFSSRKSGPGVSPRRTAQELEEMVLDVRKQLATSDLGEVGDEAIRRELLARGVEQVPCSRTIARILVRNGALDGRMRVRRPSPPPGWHLPEVAAHKAELDCFDFIEGLVIKGGTEVCVLTGLSLHGALCAAWPLATMSAKNAVKNLLSHWRATGLPHYAQFDNGTVFAGPKHYTDVLSRIMRLCLALQVTAVFAPPAEHGIQNAIEGFNARWQQKVWSRFEHRSLADLRKRSGAYVTAANGKNTHRQDAAPARSRFPTGFDEAALICPPHKGRLVFLRRADESGAVRVLGRSFKTRPSRANKLVRAELVLEDDVVRLYGLRRTDPADQPLLAEHHYHLNIRTLKGD